MVTDLKRPRTAKPIAWKTFSFREHPEAVKAVNEKDRTIEHLISVQTVDREGEVLRSKGCKTDVYLRNNPVVMWQHAEQFARGMEHELPIGRALDVHVGDASVSALTAFAGVKQMHPFAERVFLLYRDRFLNSWSVGFETLKETRDKILPGQTGRTVWDWPLVEYSAVAIPANPGAITRFMKSLSLPDGATEEDLGKALGAVPLARYWEIAEDIGYRQAQAVDDEAAGGSLAGGKVMPLPRGGEAQEDFISRCMGHPAMNSDYPDQSQRAAVCHSQWARKKSAEVDGDDPLRWNRSLSAKLFDIVRERNPAATREIELATRYLDCEIKELRQRELTFSGTRMGAGLVALDEAVGEYAVEDVRCFVHLRGPDQQAQQAEAPLEHDVVRLNSKLRRSFLLKGTRFMRRTEGRLVVRVEPEWRGTLITVYSKDALGDEFCDRIVQRAATFRFYKGEAFSLSGEFLDPTDETWDDVFLIASNESALKRVVELVNAKGAAMENRGVIMLGEPGCLHGDTPIYDPADGTTETVQTREQRHCPFHVIALDSDGHPVVARAESPQQYEPARMVKLTFQSGRSMTVTERHRFWVGNDTIGLCFVEARRLVGAMPISALPTISEVDALRQVFEHARLGSTLEFFRSVREQDALRSWRTPEGFRVGYSTDSRRDGALLRTEEETVQGASLRQGDARLHSRVESREDDRDDERTRIFQHASALPARLDCGYLTALRPADGFVSELPVGLGVRVGVKHEAGEQSLRSGARSCTTTRLERDVLGSSDCYPPSASHPSSFSIGLTQYSSDVVVLAEDVGVAPYYDFHVPGHENYWACGFFHHNTGKTLSARVMRNETREVPGQREEATFVWISARDFYRMSSFGGIEHAFDVAKENAPALLVFEDVDNWIGRGEIDLLKTTMDGVARTKGIVTVLTTNDPAHFPTALIDRPGRFHDVLKVDLPDADQRARMLAKWAPELSTEAASAAVEATDGYSGAHVRELARFGDILREQDGVKSADEAIARALVKVREQRDLIGQTHAATSRYAPRAAVVEAVKSASNAWVMGTGRKAVPPNPSGYGASDAGTAWSAPTLGDFTGKGWGDLSAGERGAIARHYAYATALPPAAFGDLKLPHHDPKSHDVNFRACAAIMAVLMGGRGGVSLGGDRRQIYDHVARHYRTDFTKEPPAYKAHGDVEIRTLIDEAALTDDEVASAWDALEVGEVKAPAMMTCPACQATTPGWFKTCKSCGAPLASGKIAGPGGDALLRAAGALGDAISALNEAVQVAIGQGDAATCLAVMEIQGELAEEAEELTELLGGNGDGAIEPDDGGGMSAGTAALAARRIEVKDGRVLSAVNHDKLKKAHGMIGDVIAAHEATRPVDPTAPDTPGQVPHLTKPAKGLDAARLTREIVAQVAGGAPASDLWFDDDDRSALVDDIRGRLVAHPNGGAARR